MPGGSIDRVVTAAHVGAGLLCLCAPDRTARATGLRPSRARRAAVVALGLRHLAEAPIAGRRARRWALVAAGVDGVHAATMVGVAAARSHLRRAAGTSAVIAAALAVAELVEATASAPVS